VPYGYTDPTWEKAIKQVARALREAARTEEDVSYTELVSRLDAVDLEPHDPRLTRLLDDTAQAYRPKAGCLITALAINKSTGRPGGGFFDLASRLGLDVSDRDAFWLEQRQLAIEYLTSAKGRRL